jgi:hypothetical protein
MWNFHVVAVALDTVVVVMIPCLPSSSLLLLPPCCGLQDLGPGSHDTADSIRAVQRRVLAATLPHSPRFVGKADPSKNLGSTYKQDW